MKFCPNCGASQSLGLRSPPHGGAFGQAVKKPPFARLFYVCYFGLGVPFVLLGAILMVTGGSSINIVVGLLFLLEGLSSFASGYGLAQIRRWARLTGIPVGVAYLLLGIFLVFASNALFNILGALAIIFGANILAYLNLPRIRAYLVV
jgi:hypothetical protein